MKFLSILAIVSFSLPAAAISLSDYPHYRFKTLFTNPICKNYQYKENVVNHSGEYIEAKTRNAFCTSRDKYSNKKRKNTPYAEIQRWIKDSSTKELFLAFLSFSEKSIADSLCKAVNERSVKLSLIVDRNNRKDGRDATVKRLQRCVKKKSLLQVRYVGGENGLGYAHNKILIVNPTSQDKIKIAFASANLSSGVLTHHENWNFVTTHVDSYFAQIHLCVKQGMEEFSNSKAEFSRYFTSCQSEIEAQEESDIKTFFVPGKSEGSRALKVLLSAMRKAKEIKMTAHRFSYGKIISQLNDSLKQGKTVQLVLDDDLYYTEIYKRPMGRNSKGEASKVRGLVNKGAEVKYIETWMDVETDPKTKRPNIFIPAGGQLQHNKIALLEYGRGKGAVFAGAGNFTGAAFSRNFENFYLITIAEVVQSYRTQYQYLFEKLGKGFDEMPTEFSQP